MSSDTHNSRQKLYSGTTQNIEKTSTISHYQDTLRTSTNVLAFLQQVDPSSSSAHHGVSHTLEHVVQSLNELYSQLENDRVTLLQLAGTP